jgi:hypothetical protein
VSVYLVTYDLRAPERDYESLYGRLADWNAVPLLESVWLIDAIDTTAAVIRDDLAAQMDRNDGLFVTRMRKSWAGRQLEPGASDWLTSDDRTWA